VALIRILKNYQYSLYSATLHHPAVTVQSEQHSDPHFSTLCRKPVSGRQ